VKNYKPQFCAVKLGFSAVTYCISMYFQHQSLLASWTAALFTVTCKNRRPYNL